MSMRRKPVDWRVASEGPEKLSEPTHDADLRMDAEDDLVSNSARFYSLEGMVILDTESIILSVNDTFSRITGYSQAEAVGKKSALFHPNRTELAAFGKLVQRPPGEMSWRGDTWDRRKNGELYPVWLNVMAVEDGENRVTHFIASFVDLSEIQTTEQRIHHLAYYDGLTQLPNRELMLDRLQQALMSSERKQSYGAVLLIDLDDFKNINDVLGHALGDAMLAHVSERLRDGLYPCDTLARVGGDEFVVVLEGLDSRESTAASRAELVAQRLLQSMAMPFDLSGHRCHSSASIGVALFCGMGVESAALISRAETAMYRAKQGGRNAIQFFDMANQSALEMRFSLSSSMRQALPDQFCLNYQVQSDHQGIPFGAEALIRWRHPEKGMIAPMPIPKYLYILMPLCSSIV